MRTNRDRPVVVYTRIRDWASGKYNTDKMRLVPAFIDGEEPVTIKGLKAGDDVGTMATKEGVEHLVSLFRKLQPEIFFYWPTYGAFDQPLMQMLRGISPNTLWIFGQGNQVIFKGKVDKWIWDNRKYVDVVLTNTYDQGRWKRLYKWNAQAVDVLYDGFNEDVHTAPSKPAEHDCFFGGGNTIRRDTDKVGNFPNSRIRFDLVTKAYKRYKTLVYGGKKGWWNIPDVHRGVIGQEYLDAMQSAKVILSCPHYNLERYYTKREIFGLASGRLVLSFYIPGMEKDFGENHKHLVWFKTLGEGLELLDHYLKNDDEREKVAKAGREFAIENHSWRARLRQFEVIVKKLRRLY